MAEGCGTCTLCCKLLGVAELRKPRDRWCPHCKIGAGCAIYEAKPRSCADFSCVWLSTQTDAPHPMALDQRPDRTRVVMIQPEDPTQPFQVIVDPATPDRWGKGHTGRTLRNMSAMGAAVAVTIGHRRYMMERGGSLREVLLGPENADGSAHVIGWK